jgi:hypothetical protein
VVLFHAANPDIGVTEATRRVAELVMDSLSNVLREYTAGSTERQRLVAQYCQAAANYPYTGPEADLYRVFRIDPGLCSG